MKRRTPVLATVVAAIIATMTVGVAQAAPDPPGFSTIDGSAAGHVTGSVTSDQPFVYVWFDAGAPPVLETLSAGSAAFDLPTWGYSGTQTLHAIACPTTANDNTCSAEQTTTFTPTDVSPVVTWFSDSTVGPGQTAVVHVEDPTGGGTLQAVWANTDGAPQTTVLTPSADTPLTLVDGTGIVSIQRCSTVNPAACTGFTPAITQTLTVRTTASATLGAVASITTANPSTTATVDTNRDGTYTVAWHLEQSSVVVPGTNGTDSGSLDGSGTAAPFTIPGVGLADGNYDVVGTITVTDPSFGVFPAAPFTSASMLTVTSGPPLFSSVDASTAGHVTGTVSSLRPYVFVWFDAGAPEVMKTLSGGSAAFDLPTWGYTGTQTLHAVACPTNLHNGSCSAEQTTTFTPTDVSPVVTWYADSTVGPGGTAVVHVEDPTGGGTLQAVWANTDGAPQTTVLTPGADTPLTLVDGTGTVTIQRCSTVNTAVCTGFTPPITQPLTVRTTAAATLGTVAPITTANTSTTATVDTNRDGTYTLAWHLEQSGSPIAGANGTDSGSLNGSGTAAPFTIPGTGLAEGTYDVIGTITVTDPSFGGFPATAFNSTVTVDRTGPDLTSITVSVATIYPLVNTAAHQGSTLVTAVGPGVADVTQLQLKSGTTIVHLAVNGAGQATWYGRPTGASTGTVVTPGVYTVTALDVAGNPAGTSSQVTVSGKKLVLRTFTKTVSARASLVGKYVGRCSVLRTPSLRRWAGSLGFYSNTRCNASTWPGSAVSTEHAIRLPNAEKFVTVHVDTYGGGAATVPDSLAIVRYLKPLAGNSSTWVAQRTLPKRLTTHAGRTISLNGMLFGTSTAPSFHWGVATGFGNRYDVRKFTVVVRYYVVA